jgi:hypothetical protein
MRTVLARRGSQARSRKPAKTLIPVADLGIDLKDAQGFAYNVNRLDGS